MKALFNVLSLRKEKPQVDEMFRRSDLWAQKIMGYDKERYYRKVFLPTMRLFEYMHQLESDLKCSSSKKTVNLMFQNNLHFFEAVTNNIYKYDYTTKHPTKRE